MLEGAATHRRFRVLWRSSPSPRKAASLKILVYLALMLLLAGCIPIGARVSNMYAQATAPMQPA
jgi:hypothetical protein